MEFMIISGLSGAGKSQAADILEDLGYYCVDNMPSKLLPRFSELCLAAQGGYEHVALVVDVREKEGFKDLLRELGELKGMDIDCRILFLEADAATIVRRYKESRRPHPLAQESGSFEDAVQKEIDLLTPLRERADFVINTSNLTNAALKREIERLLIKADGCAKSAMNVTVISFGYKYGIPIEADQLFDVRFLPNPFYVDGLRDLTGMDDPVYHYVLGAKSAQDFIKKMKDFTDLLLPLYMEEGKYTLTIAFGCTGGRHRSVAIARALADYIGACGYDVRLINRDIDR